MPGYVRQPDIRVVAHPAMPVAAANAARLDLEDNTGWRRYRVGNLLDGQRPLKLLVDRGLHLFRFRLSIIRLTARLSSLSFFVNEAFSVSSVDSFMVSRRRAISLSFSTSSGTNSFDLSIPNAIRMSSGVLKYASRSSGLPLPARLSKSPRSMAAFICCSMALSMDIAQLAF